MNYLVLKHVYELYNLFGNMVTPRIRRRMHALLSRVEDGPRAWRAPTGSKKGLRRSTLTVGLQRMRRGRGSTRV